ncbi:MAG: DJ-1/PfpI family protein [Candidatus Schekmanbacteria bacterium]|nr:DJ-1/PfpI family protein [Candidatus Schekmanbacteria bacterium]
MRIPIALVIASILFPIFLAGIVQADSKKSVLMIIASKNYRDEELIVPRDFFKSKQISVTIASSTTSPAKGMLGAVVKPDIKIQDIDISKYDVLLLVGGTGASEYWDDGLVHKIATKAYNEGKIVSAICLAPVTLANAGLLKGKKATVWQSEGDTLKKKGAVYTGEAVTIDGKIITADGPASAKKFAEAVYNALEGK